VCVLAGAGALVATWIGVSGTPLAARQLPYLASGGIGGLFLLGVGAMLWISADLQDEWLKFDRLERSLDRIEAAISPMVPAAADGDLTPIGAGRGGER
jgi:hypothetical protein